MYVIRNTMDHGLAWSNRYGWVDDETYDLFDERERHTLNLPAGGEWWSLD